MIMPDEYRRCATVRPPRACQGFGSLSIRTRTHVLELVQAGLDTKIISRPDVRTAQREKQEHFRAPSPETLQPGDSFYHLIIRKFRLRCRHQGAFRYCFRKASCVADFLPRQAKCTQLVVAHAEHALGLKLTVQGRFEATEYGRRSLDRKLLAGDVPVARGQFVQSLCEMTLRQLKFHEIISQCR